MFALAGQPGQPQADQKKGDPLWLIYWLFVIHSGCFLPILRYRCGREAHGVRGLLSLVLLLLCLGFEPLMILWVGAFLIAVIVQRVITWRAIRKGAAIHSLYAGMPLLTHIPFFRKERDAMILEMILCFAIGALLMAFSQFMGVFMMLGLVSLMVRTGIEDSVYHRRLDRMIDARIEGRWYGDRMR